MKSSQIMPELSRPLIVDKISAGGVEEHLVANAAERKAVAERFGLLDILKLEAHLDIDPVRAGKMFAVRGELFAEVVQQCVVSLDPVAAKIRQKIDVLFAPPSLLEVGEGSNQHTDADEQDPPEPIENGVIDLGEVVAQQLFMGLEPYPRKSGVTFGALEFGVGIEAEAVAEKASNPFAKLVKFKPKTKK